MEEKKETRQKRSKKGKLIKKNKLDTNIMVEETK